MSENDISIDIETLSTRFDAAVLSIGAVAFNRNTGAIGEKVYVEVEVTSAMASGHVSGSTLEWWMQQDEKARQLFCAPGKSHLSVALSRISMFITCHDGAKVWGNGATFDITILEQAYTRLGLTVPWEFWNIRDMRTIVEAATAMGFDKRTVPFEGTKHNAIDDAVHQARVIASSWAFCRAPVAAPTHPDDIAVDRFATAMKAKMAKQRAKGYDGWDQIARCTDKSLADKLMAHTKKGDPIDVANFAMMLHQRNPDQMDIAIGTLRGASLDFAKRVASMWMPEPSSTPVRDQT